MTLRSCTSARRIRRLDAQQQCPLQTGHVPGLYMLLHVTVTPHLASPSFSNLSDGTVGHRSRNCGEEDKLGAHSG